MSLRAAITAAREANMPSDNITRAVKKGTGELEGVNRLCKGGGNLATEGAVSWGFTRSGVISVKPGLDEDQLLENFEVDDSLIQEMS